MCFLGSLFCLLFSYVCPNAVFRINMFCYLCFNLSSSPSFLRAASEYVRFWSCSGGYVIFWRRVKFNAVPLDLPGIILCVDPCQYRTVILWECIFLRFCSVRSPLFNCICVRQGPEGWYIWNSVRRLRAARADKTGPRHSNNVIWIFIRVFHKAQFCHIEFLFGWLLTSAIGTDFA